MNANSRSVCVQWRGATMLHQHAAVLCIAVSVVLVCCRDSGRDVPEAAAEASAALNALVQAADSKDAEAVAVAVRGISLQARESEAFRVRIVDLLQARVPSESNDVAEEMGLKATPSVLALCEIRGKIGISALARGLGPYFESMAGARTGPSANSSDNFIDFSTLTDDEINALLEILMSKSEPEGARIGAALMLPWSRSAILGSLVSSAYEDVLASDDASPVLKTEVLQARLILNYWRKRVHDVPEDSED